MKAETGELVVTPRKVLDIRVGERWGEATLGPVDPMEVPFSQVGGFTVHLTAEEARALSPGATVEFVLRRAVH